MSIDWPYKQEDIEDLINHLEKKLNLKNTEIQTKVEQIIELDKNLEDYENRTRKLKAKSELIEEEILRFETELDRSILKNNFLHKEIESLQNKLELKINQITQIDSENNKLKNQITKIEPINQESLSSRLKNFLKDIKKIFSYKGFLSEIEFDDLTKDHFLSKQLFSKYK